MQRIQITQIFRLFSSLPRNFIIPIHEIEFSSSRSSGPGGQNVNKVNSKAEIRFKVETAEWIPLEVRTRLIEQRSNRINKNGELVITSQEQRSQAQNRDECFAKLKEYLGEELQNHIEKEINCIVLV